MTAAIASAETFDPAATKAESRFGGSPFPRCSGPAGGGGARTGSMRASSEIIGAVQEMHEAMSPDNIYLRFFSYSHRQPLELDAPQAGAGRW